MDCGSWEISHFNAGAKPADLPVIGVILADQLKSMDWKARRAEFAASVSDEVVGEVIALVPSLIEEADP
jgi:mRNA interferase MazF